MVARKTDGCKLFARISRKEHLDGYMFLAADKFSDLARNVIRYRNYGGRAL